MTAMDPAGFSDAAVDRVRDELAGVDLEALRASFGLIRASNRLVQHLERSVHRPAGWSMAGFRIMFCVWVAGELEPREIAHYSGLSRAAVSSALNTLERDRLITRVRESTDRRLVTVRLSPDGEQGVRDAYRAQNQTEQAFFAGLSPSEMTQFTRTLQHMLDQRIPNEELTDAPA